MDAGGTEPEARKPTKAAFGIRCILRKPSCAETNQQSANGGIEALRGREMLLRREKPESAVKSAGRGRLADGAWRTLTAAGVKNAQECLRRPRFKREPRSCSSVDGAGWKAVSKVAVARILERLMAVDRSSFCVLEIPGSRIWC